MTPYPYTEDQLFEQPALALLSELGWATVNARDEILGADGTLGRETTSEVVLAPRLRTALERLNPDVPPDVMTAAVDQLIFWQHRAATSSCSPTRRTAASTTRSR